MLPDINEVDGRTEHMWCDENGNNQQCRVWGRPTVTGEVDYP